MVRRLTTLVVLGALLTLPAISGRPIESVKSRFLRYAAINTQSREDTDSVPSTGRQFTLARLLVEELRQMGIHDAGVDEHCFVTATLPSNLPPETTPHVPVIGFFAHLDTSPETPDDHVHTSVRTYHGGTITLADDTSQHISPTDNPHLLENVGSEIITAGGSTLLGGDDKAGIAEIMTAVDLLLSDSTIRHGTVKIAFTPDEEAGDAIDLFDVHAFGAQYAYTIDGGTTGEINVESWNASEATVVFHGRNAHPGSAYGKMINSMYMLADFISRLPESMRPENTEKRAGFVHPSTGTLGVGESKLKLLLRSFDTKGIEKQERILADIRSQTLEHVPGGTIDITVKENYRNMKAVLDSVPFVAEYAAEACRRAGVEPAFVPMRGGTDGTVLTFKGLPCPNLFTGDENPHSTTEWLPVRGMERAVQTIVNTIAIWTEKSLPRK